MLSQYTLMKKEAPVADLVLNQTGTFVEAHILNKSLTPICDLEHNGLAIWWKNRSVPENRDRLQELLKKNGVSIPEEYLMKNLGLGLTDPYWIKPPHQQFTWKEVNLFENDFLPDNTANIYEMHSKTSIAAYSPNSTLQGQVEKEWRIVNNKRCLIKGNTFRQSTQSINEVAASKIHQMQEYDNYTNYTLVKIKHRLYNYGCMCNNFCTPSLELVPVWDILQAHKEQIQDNPYEALIHICTNIYGMDEEPLRADLEYQIETDFLLSNTDRHLNNIGILRDADTLQFLRMAPIFDTGNSMFYNSVPFADRTALSELEVNSFFPRELQMLAQIKEPKRVFLDRLPSFECLRELYLLDDKIPKEHLEKCGKAYEKKKEMLEEFQQGKLINRQGELIRPYHIFYESSEKYKDKQKPEMVSQGIRPEVTETFAFSTEER